MKWYKIASERVDPLWWGTVLAPLMQLESEATGGVIHLERDGSNGHEEVGPSTDPLSQNCTVPHNASLTGKVTMEIPKEPPNKLCGNSSAANPFIASRSSLEDMELETRALTEPLPTNQQVSGFLWFFELKILHRFVNVCSLNFSRLYAGL